MVWIVLLIAYTFLLWVDSDYDPDFLRIDTCYDKGGVWHDNARTCYYSDEEKLKLDQASGQ